MGRVNGTGEEARQFARALGLNPEKIRKIVLTVEAEEPVSVDVEMYVHKEDLGNLGLEVQRFELHSTEDE